MRVTPKASSVTGLLRSRVILPVFIAAVFGEQRPLEPQEASTEFRESSQMKKGIISIRSKGFTLIEVLVTVVVIGVLAAVVIPAVTSQVSAGDSSRVISDLNNLRTGIENYYIGVRQFPGDVDDLVSAPGTSASTSGLGVDADLSGGAYLSTASWAGPYMEATVPSTIASSTVSVSGAAFSTGYAATINNHLSPCNITSAAACDATSANYVVVQIDNLTAAQITTLNNSIDGLNENSSGTAGKFRFPGTNLAYYFATPFK